MGVVGGINDERKLCREGVGFAGGLGVGFGVGFGVLGTRRCGVEGIELGSNEARDPAEEGGNDLRCSALA